MRRALKDLLKMGRNCELEKDPLILVLLKGSIGGSLFPAVL